MSINPSLSAPPQSPQFNALMRHRRRLAVSGDAPWLHAEVARRMADKLDAILLSPAQWLDWSGHVGGTGDLLVDRYPLGRSWVHEPEAALAQQVEARWQAAHIKPWWAAWKKKQSSPVLHDLEGPKPEGWPNDGVDMLWANMSLHASADVDALIKQWHGLLRTDGFLMCSGLGPDTARELRAVYGRMGWGLPTVDFIDMHDLGDALVQAGFSDPVMDMERLTLTWPDARAMLTECRSWGGNVALGRFAGCRTPRWHKQLLRALDDGLKRPDGRLGLTIELVYGHAMKPLPKVMVQAESRVSLDDMRRMIKGRDSGKDRG